MARAVPVHPALRRILVEWRVTGCVPSRRARIRSRKQHRNEFLEDTTTNPLGGAGGMDPRIIDVALSSSGLSRDEDDTIDEALSRPQGGSMERVMRSLLLLAHQIQPAARTSKAPSRNGAV